LFSSGDAPDSGVLSDEADVADELGDGGVSNDSIMKRGDNAGKLVIGRSIEF
jgi:hypothetical protein